MNIDKKSNTYKKGAICREKRPFMLKVHFKSSHFIDMELEQYFFSRVGSFLFINALFDSGIELPNFKTDITIK